MLKIPKKLLNYPPLKLPEAIAGFERHLLFLNNLEFPTQFLAVIRSEEHGSKAMGGWEGILSLTCLGEDEELYDIDVRYAWGSEIFNQNLFDFGWSEATLLHKKLPHEPPRHKLIIYLCEASTGLQISQKSDSVPKRFAIGQYWQTIHHFYLLLPLDHPFILPPVRSNPNHFGDYATTRCLTTEKPTFVNEVDNGILSLLFLPPHSLRQGEGGLRMKGMFKKINKDRPIISVITVVFNGEKYLEQTIQSVINQSASLEYLIIDGGSTDNTLKIIKKYENQIDYWVSEADGGIYDAMNKGTLSALGTHTLHINGDDLLLQPNSLPQQFPLVNLMYGGLALLEEGIVVKQLPRQPHANIDINVIHSKVSHQGFIGIKNGNSVFYCDYGLVADRIVMARKIEGEHCQIKPRLISLRRSGGVTSEVSHMLLKEIRKALGKPKSFTVQLSYIKLWCYCSLRQVAKRIGLVKLKRLIWI